MHNRNKYKINLHTEIFILSIEIVSQGALRV